MACRTAPRWGGATRGLDPAPGSRRVLRLGRAAGQAVLTRQARRRGRDRGARGGGDRVVRGPGLRRPLGDAGLRGAPPLPARRLLGRPLRGVPDRQWAGHDHPARSVPAGRTAVPGRGVSRSVGRPASGRLFLRRAANADRDPQSRGRRGDGWAHRVGRRGHLEVRGQGGQRARQAGRHRGRRAGVGGRSARPDERRRHPRGRTRDAGAVAPDRHSHRRGPAAFLAGRARSADRPGARLGAGRAGVRARRPSGRAGAGDQVDLGGGHLRAATSPTWPS